MPLSGDVAVVIPAKDEADRIARDRESRRRSSPGWPWLWWWTTDHGMAPARPRRARGPVLRHARCRGKGAALETGAQAVRLLDGRSPAEPRLLLFLDADLAESAAAAAPLIEPVRAGQADMTIAVFRERVKQAAMGSWWRCPAPASSGPPAGPGPAAERPAVPDPGRVRGGPAAGAQLGRGNRADHRPAPPRPAGDRGRGAADAPGHRRRLAGPAAPGPAVRRGRLGADHPRAPGPGRAPGAAPPRAEGGAPPTGLNNPAPKGARRRLDSRSAGARNERPSDEGRRRVKRPRRRKKAGR